MNKSILRNGGWSIIPVCLICLLIILYGLLNNTTATELSGIPVYFLVFGVPTLIQIRINIKENKTILN